jgi:hypothetical protein
MYYLLGKMVINLRLREGDSMMRVDDQRIPRNVMPRVLVISLPKSGTNVLESTLAEFEGMSEAKRLGLNNRMRLHPFNWIPFSGQEECLMGVTRPVRVKLSAVKSSLKRISPGEYALGHIPYQKNVHELIRQLYPFTAFFYPEKIRAFA